MNAKAKPPGPPNGLIGWKNFREIGRDTLAHARSLAAEYGDSVYFRVGPLNVYQFSHPEQFHEVLVEKASSFHKPARFKQVLGRWNGNALVMNEGKSWARQRRLVQGAFHPRMLQAYAEITARRAEQLVAQSPLDKRFDIAAAISQLTFGVVAESLFGEEVEPVAAEFAAHVETLQEVAMADFGSLWVTPLWWPTANRRRLRESMKFIDELVFAMIERRRNATQQGEPQTDLLAMMLAAEDDEGDGGSMTSQQARDESVSLLLAGNETTATALKWTVYLLARHPEMQDRVAREIASVAGDGPLKYEDVRKLTYTAMAFQESMRLYPPAYFTSRQAIEPVIVGGYELPRGAMAHLPIYVPHRDERWFDQPDEFRPERFDEAKDDIPRCAYLPFGAGPRACIGKNFAMMEGVLVLATILRRHSVVWDNAQPDPVAEAQVSLHPRGGLQLQLTRRQFASQH